MTDRVTDEELETLITEIEKGYGADAYTAIRVCKELRSLRAVEKAAEETIDRLLKEGEWMFRRLPPEDKTAALEMMGVSKEMQERSWQRVKAALDAAMGGGR